MGCAHHVFPDRNCQPSHWLHWLSWGRNGTVRSPGGLRRSLQVASEVTYMEHMCLSHLVVVAFTLATEEGCEWVRRRWLTMTTRMIGS